MTDVSKPVKDTSDRPAPLSDVLGKNQLVQDRVAQAGVNLSSVNVGLKGEVVKGEHPVLDEALDQSEAIEAEVHEVARELVVVNQALAGEVADRKDLEQQLSESQTKEREARHDALHDDVTGLPNLALFHDRLANAMAQAKRHGWRLAVMFIDLDDFKIVNDTHGHDVGDLVLVTVAERLRSLVRSGDTVCRRSGDEFLVLMLEAKDGDNAAAFATTIIARLAEPFERGQVSLSVSASVGIAIYPEDGASAPALLKGADLAMYAAKREKKGWELTSRIPPDDRTPR